MIVVSVCEVIGKMLREASLVNTAARKILDYIDFSMIT